MFVDDDNDSYRAATEGKGGQADDNRTATGTIKARQMRNRNRLSFIPSCASC
jgi:hypothetical protein